MRRTKPFQNGSIDGDKWSGRSNKVTWRLGNGVRQTRRILPNHLISQASWSGDTVTAVAHGQKKGLLGRTARFRGRHSPPGLAIGTVPASGDRPHGASTSSTRSGTSESTRATRAPSRAKPPTRGTHPGRACAAHSQPWQSCHKRKAVGPGLGSSIRGITQLCR